MSNKGTQFGRWLKSLGAIFWIDPIFVFGKMMPYVTLCVDKEYCSRGGIRALRLLINNKRIGRHESGVKYLVSHRVSLPVETFS